MNQRYVSVAERMALRVAGAREYNAEIFTSTLGSIGPRSFGEVISGGETLELLAGTASFPARTFTDKPGRYPTPGDVPARAPRLIDYVRKAPTDAGIVQYSRETSRPDPAAETAKGDLVPDASADDFEAEEVRVRQIPVGLTANRSELADLAGLQLIFETRLRSSIAARLEHQLVQGNGTGENLTGILDASVGIPSVIRDTSNSELMYEVMLRGLANVRETLYDEPSAIAISPLDWRALLDERDHDGHLIVSGEERASRQIESVPIVPTVAAPQGTPIVGAWDLGVVVRIRSGTSIDLSDSHEDFFAKRLVAILATLRAAVTVPTPRAFCEVIF